MLLRQLVSPVAQQLLCANYYPDLGTPSYRKYQRQKTGCILYQENTPRNLNILCYDNIVIPLLPLLSQWVEGTVGTTIVVITPTDGLRQSLVGIRCTRSEA